MCFEKCFLKKKKFYIRFFHSSHNYNYNYTIIPLDPGFSTYHKPYERCQKLVVNAIYNKLYNKIILSHN